tara:strand:+ start:120 stop:335 length:216 start_codon:yes stop_codon:yes gene_type:complete
MLITIHIPNKEKRIKLANQIEKIIGKCQTYIPSARPVYQCDIGIKSTIDEKQYKHIIALLDRRGLTYNIKE